MTRTALDYLRDAGIKLGLPVGVVVSSRTKDNVRRPQHARVTRVLSALPERLRGTAEETTYDLTSHLCVLWPAYQKADQVCFFSTEGASLIADGGTFCIETEEQVIVFSQEQEFMDVACKLWQATEGGAFVN